MPDDTFICDRCGNHHHVEECTVFDEQALCTDSASDFVQFLNAFAKLKLIMPGLLAKLLPKPRRY